MALGLPDVAVGTWTHPRGHTGCTVVLPPPGSMGACAVRGGAPGTREAAALGPGGQGAECHGIFLSGGSAFGLAVGDGVARWSEANGRGYDRFVTPVPVIGGAILFDLREAGAERPDFDSGWAACEAATTEDPPMGVVGVGAGATVSKSSGFEHIQPGGQGWAVARGRGVTVGALMAVNAFGHVLAEDGSYLAGPPTGTPGGPHGYPYQDPRIPLDHTGDAGDLDVAAHPRGNTVIGCIVTDAVLTKAQAHRAADLAHTGIARTVDPPHTAFDGDALFLLTTKQTEVESASDLVAHLASQAVAQAIRAAVRASRSA